METIQIHVERGSVALVACVADKTFGDLHLGQLLSPLYGTFATWDSNKQPLRHVGYLAAGFLSLIFIRPPLAAAASGKLGGVLAAFILAPLLLWLLAGTLGTAGPLLSALGPLTLERAVYAVVGIVLLTRYVIGRRLVKQWAVDHAMVRLSA